MLRLFLAPLFIGQLMALTEYTATLDRYGLTVYSEAVTPNCQQSGFLPGGGTRLATGGSVTFDHRLAEFKCEKSLGMQSRVTLTVPPGPLKLVYRDGILSLTDPAQARPTIAAALTFSYNPGPRPAMRAVVRASLDDGRSQFRSGACAGPDTTILIPATSPSSSGDVANQSCSFPSLSPRVDEVTIHGVVRVTLELGSLVDSVYLAITATYRLQPPLLNSLSLVPGSINPGPAAQLEPGSRNFEAGLRYTYTFDDASLYLRLFDAPRGGRMVASSQPSAIKKEDGGGAEKTLTLSAAIDSPGEVFLRGQMLHANGELAAETASVRYQVVEERDPRINHIEAVQVVQTADHMVPLIVGKSGVVRVFAGEGLSPRALSNASLRIHAEDANGPIAGSPREISPITLQPRTGFDRDSLDSFDINIPPSWLARDGTVLLRAELGLPAGVTDKDTTNNTRTISVNRLRLLAEGTKFRLGYVSYCFQAPGETQPKCPTDRVGQFDTLVRKLFPIPDDGVQYFRAWTPTRPVAVPFTAAGLDRFKTALRRKFLASDELQAQMDQLAAWVPGNADPVGVTREQRAPGGSSDPKWSSASNTGRIFWARDRTQQGSGLPALAAARTLAHETSHNLGLQHVGPKDPCGSRSDNPTWPDTYPNETIQEPGFDPLRYRLVRKSRPDLMSYCGASQGTSWISPHNYQNLIGGALLPRALPGKGVREAETGDFLIVTGSVRRDGGVGSLNPVLRVTNGPADTFVAAGTHCLRLGSDYCFTPSFTDIEPEEGTPTERDEASFSFKIPYAAGRLVLAKGDTELAALSAGSGPPRVSISSPQQGSRQRGPIRIVWTATDPDNRPMVFAVQYSSNNGATWLTLEDDLADRELTVESSQLRGGAQVHFRVFACAALDCGVATVGPLAIDQTPRLELESPSVMLPKALVGQSSVGTIVVRNSGDGPVAIGPVRSNSDVFTPTDGTSETTLGAGESLPIDVTFTPLTDGAKSARVTVAPGLEVQVSAKGITELEPTVDASPTALDFGNVTVGQSRTLSATVRNLGPGILSVTSVEVVGDGFSLVPPVPSFDLAPDTSRQVEVRFAPAVADAVLARLTFAGSDPDRRFVDVALRGVGVTAPPFTFSPDRLDFGEVATGEFRELTVTLRNTTTAPVVVSPATDNPRFTATPASVTVAVGGQQGVVVRFSPNAAGPQAGTLTLGTARIPLAGTGRSASGSVQATPATLEFAQVAVGETRDLTVVVRNTGNTPASVSATSNNARYTVTPASAIIPVGGQQTFTVRFAPVAAGPQPGVITIGSATVAVTGTGRTVTAGLQVTPATLAFGEVGVGQTRELSLTLRNTGVASVTLTPTSDNPRFAASGTVTVPPGGDQTVSVRFTPIAAGTQTGILSLGSLTVVLTGIGVAPSGNPVPTITSMSPTSALAGDAGFALRVVGTGFVQGSVVQWNGTARNTQTLSPTELAATITPGDIANSGSAVVTVANPPPGGGVATGSLTFRIDGPQPVALLSQFETGSCPDITAYVSPLDTNGAPIDTLLSGAFTCTLGGDRVPCVAAQADTPISLVIGVSLQGLSSEEQETVRTVARGLVAGLRPSDRGALVHIERTPNPAVTFTNERARLNDTITQLRPVGDGNPLYDAVGTAASLFADQAGRRHIVVMVTGQGNSGGSASEQDAVNRAQTSNMPFYSIGIGANAPAGFLRQLATVSHARAYLESLATAIPRVNPLWRVLVNQYAVQFVGRNDGLPRPFGLTIAVGADRLSVSRPVGCR